jgi:NitT/TauT family transport system substrate-binding protein
MSRRGFGVTGSPCYTEHMSKPGPRLILAFVGILLLTGAVAAVWTRQPGPSAPAGPPEKIRIANIGIYSNYNILADRLGLFRENGLDAEVVEYDSGATSMDALASGKADVAVAASFVGARRMFSDGHLRILATVSAHDVFRVLARRDKGIAKPFDLKGKKIGVTLKTAGEFYLGRFLTAHGLKREDVTIVDLSATDIMAGIGSGGIDAAVVFDPNAYRVEQALAGDVVSWSAQGNRRELATLYTTDRFIAERPEALERYVRAIVDAERYQAGHVEEAKRLLAEALAYDKAYIDHLWLEFDFAIRLDQELLVSMEDQARWNIQNGLAAGSDAPDYLGRVHFQALEAVKPSGVTIIHGP